MDATKVIEEEFRALAGRLDEATLLRDLDALVEPTARGDPQSPLRWTCKSTPRLAKEWVEQGHPVSQRTVCNLLARLDYSQRPGRFAKGGNRPIATRSSAILPRRRRGIRRRATWWYPLIPKRKNGSGDFKNCGREWQPKGDPEAVRVYDFIDPQRGKVTPYGVYDVGANPQVG